MDYFIKSNISNNNTNFIIGENRRIKNLLKDNHGVKIACLGVDLQSATQILKNKC